MNISQERFDRVILGFIELLTQRHVELDQQRIWFEERDERITRLDQEIKVTKFDATQARIEKEEAISKRHAAERFAADAKANIDAWDKKFDNLNKQRIEECNKYELYLKARDKQIAALQATITQLKKQNNNLRTKLSNK